MSARAAVALVLATIALAPAPACDSSPALSTTSRTIVLLGGQALDGSERAATRLEDLTRASRVLGEAPELVALGAPDDSVSELTARLRGLSEARAVFALLGDLSAFSGVDPNEEIRIERRLSERDWDRGQLLDDVKALRARCQELGARLILATAPLGRRARVEVPELLALHAWLARHFDQPGTGLVFLELAEIFDERGGRDLFSDGVTRLDQLGQDLLAETLHDLLATREALLPTRDENEAIARRDARVVLQWIAGEDAELQTLAKGLRQPGLDRRASTLRAAASLAVLGQRQSVKDRFVEILAAEPDGELPAGLTLGRRFAGEWSPTVAPRDPLEAELVTMLDTLVTRSDEDWDAAISLSRRYPQRLSAWIALEFARQRLHRGLNTLQLARQARAIFDSPISDERFAAIAKDWSRANSQLPLLLIAESAQVDTLPRGELLTTARRRERLGMPGHAATYLENRVEHSSYPPEWLAEIERLRD